MKIYTRTGDDGTTGLRGGKRLSKRSPRIEAYGTVDELNAAVGVARAALGAAPDPDLDRILARVQEELFVVGAELSRGEASEARSPEGRIGPEQVAALETEIDRWEGELEALRNFVLPGGAPAAAALHLARTVCRRAERRLLALSEAELVAADLLAYLNRLSDHLFVAARTANRRAGRADVPWRPRG